MINISQCFKNRLDNKLTMFLTKIFHSRHIFLHCVPSFHFYGKKWEPFLFNSKCVKSGLGLSAVNAI